MSCAEEQIAYADKIFEGVFKFVEAYKKDDRVTMRKAIHFAVDTATIFSKNGKLRQAKKNGAFAKALSELVT